MPVVPVYDNFQEQPGVRRGQVQAAPVGDAAAITGRQLGDLGGAIQAAAQAGGDIVQAEQEKANKLRLNDAYNQAIQVEQELRTEYQKLKAGAVQNVQGRPLAEYYTEKLQSRVGEIYNGLGNNSLRTSFELLGEDLVTRFRGGAMSYEAEQYAVYANEVYDATVAQSFNVISSDPFKPVVVDAQLDRAKQAVRAKLAAAGFDEASGLEERTKEVIGKGHANVIDTLLEGADAEGAQAYFDKHEDDFNATDAEMIRAKLGKATSASRALKDVDTLLQQMPLSGRNPPLSTLDKKLREVVGDDPVRLAAARDELNYRVRNHVAQADAAYAANFDRVFGMIQGGTPPTEIYQHPAYLALDSKDSFNFYNLMKQQYDAQRAEENLGRYFDIVYDQAGLQRLKDMTDSEARMLINDVGVELFPDIMKLRSELKKGSTTVLEATVDTDHFNTIALTMGYDPYGANKPKEKAKIGQLRNVAETAIDQEQTRLGRKLSRAEKDAVIRSTLSNQVTIEKGGVFGFFKDKSTMPAAMLPEEDIKNVVIPKDVRLQITAALQVMYEETGNSEYEPTEANIRREFLNSRGLDAGQ